jgi:hypothetical protein
MIHQSDLIIREAVSLGLDDLRKNEWLIDDILSQCATNTYLQDKYGQKQIDAAKEWIRNNQVDIYMAHRRDRDKLPCVTISLGSSSEKEDMKTLSDLSTDTVQLLPNVIGKPIAYIVKPFTILNYDIGSGEVSIDSTTKGLENVSPGMILVDPSNGNGYVILEITPNGVSIEPGTNLTATILGILPGNQFYTARVEHTWFQETYTIGIHCHGDPQTLLWLHSFVLFGLLRYREGLLEANGLYQSVVSSSDLSVSGNLSTPGAEEIYSRFISLSCMVESTWIKSPKRTLETVALREKVGNGYKGGIKIISNSEPDTLIQEMNELWYPIKG